MTLSQRAVEAALDKWHEKEDATGKGQQTAMRDALTAALAVEGLCLVPKDPTQAMLDAGDDLVPVARGTETYTMARGRKGYPEDIYRAMIAAASDGEERK